MNRIKRFEDFIAWQKARKLTARIYKTTSEGEFARDFGLKDSDSKRRRLRDVKHS